MSPEAALQQAIEEQPGDEAPWLVLADWLEESGQADRAELLRLQVALRRGEGGPGRRAQEGRLQALLLGGAYPWALRRQIRLGRGAELTLVLVPPGRFVMGSPVTERGRDPVEGPAHAVTVTRAFWLGAYPVTQAQWKAVMGDNPSQFAGDARPVDGVSWFDAVELCRRLTGQTGRPFRLPSEAEWEYACRAGTSTAYSLGDDVEAMRRAGWCNVEVVPGIDTGTHRVSLCVPNAFGLYDMHGNVWEWCHDWYAEDYYARSPAEDPPGPVTGVGRVVRGGSWYFSPRISRSAYRFFYARDFRSNSHGCRVVMDAAAG